MTPPSDDRYYRLAPLVEALRADRRYRVREKTNHSSNTDLPRRTVSVYGPVSREDIEARLPAPSDLHFRRWSPDFVTIADPDADPDRRPTIQVAVHFHPPLRWWQTSPDASPQGDARWASPVVTPGSGLATPRGS